MHLAASIFIDRDAGLLTLEDRLKSQRLLEFSQSVDCLATDHVGTKSLLQRCLLGLDDLVNAVSLQELIRLDVEYVLKDAGISTQGQSVLVRKQTHFTLLMRLIPTATSCRYQSLGAFKISTVRIAAESSLSRRALLSRHLLSCSRASLGLVVERGRLHVSKRILFMELSIVSQLHVCKPLGLLLMHEVGLMRHLIALFLLVAGHYVVLFIVDLGCLGLSVWPRAILLARIILRVLDAVGSILNVVLLALRCTTLEMQLGLMVIIIVVIVVSRLASIVLASVVSRAAGLGTVESLGASLASLGVVAAVVVSLFVHVVFLGAF